MFEVILVIMMFVAAIVGCVFAALSEKKYKENHVEEISDSDEYIEPEFISVGATVLGKGGFHKYYGTKITHHTLLFRVAFMTDDGDEVIFEIPQEIYDRISEGQHGDLVTVNGNFFDFGDGETVPESEEAEK